MALTRRAGGAAQAWVGLHAQAQADSDLSPWLLKGKSKGDGWVEGWREWRLAERQGRLCFWKGSTQQLLWERALPGTHSCYLCFPAPSLPPPVLTAHMASEVTSGVALAAWAFAFLPSWVCGGYLFKNSLAGLYSECFPSTDSLKSRQCEEWEQLLSTGTLREGPWEPRGQGHRHVVRRGPCSVSPFISNEPGRSPPSTSQLRRQTTDRTTDGGRRSGSKTMTGVSVTGQIAEGSGLPVAT